MLFEEIIAVYSENRTEQAELLFVKAVGTYTYQTTLKG
jgi:hypothetical protein